MKKIFVFIFVLVAAAAFAASEPGKNNGQDKPAEKTQAAPVAGEESRQGQQRSGSWPRPFVPSEKIGADSVISFPADI